MRIALLAATIGVIAFAGMSDFARAQSNNSCKSMCDCGSLQCTDFCSPTACGGGTCRKRFDAMVKACEKACDRCNRFSKAKKG